MLNKRFPILSMLFSFVTLILWIFMQKPALSALPGQIMVDPNNDSWLVYNRDNNGDGKKDPFFMCGAGEPEEFLYTEGTTYAQADDVINKISGTGANAVYFQLIRTGGDVRPGQPTKQDPFIDNNPSTRGANIDLIRQWKSKWFDRLDSLGITMFVFFYDDTVSIGTDNEEFFRDVVNELEGYKHLIWIVGEESREAMGDGTVNSIAATIRKYDDNNHPIGNHQLEGTTFNTPTLDVFAIQYNSGGLHDAMVSAFNKSAGRYNIVMSESKSSFGMSTDELRRFHWDIAMGGAYITELDWWYHGDKGRAPSTAELQNCGNIVKFMEQTTFNEMAPNDSLKSGDTDYVLANPGSSYIAYTNGYSSGIGLQNLSGGTYDFLWYDIINNKYSVQNNVSVSSGTQNWSRPSELVGNEIVVYLTNQSGTIFTPTPGTSTTPTSTQNQAPNALSKTVNIMPGQSGYIQLQFEDDGPGPYVYTITRNPSNGNLTGNGNDRTYTPNSGFSGTDSFQWKVNDSKLDSNIATITINVQDSPITNLSVNDSSNAADWSIQGNFQNGDNQYGDRTFTFSSIPQELSGNTWIRTANDSKSYSGLVIAEFTVKSDSTVYIAHDNRINSKPSWLSGWVNTGMSFGNSEPQTFTLYSKVFLANSTVSLGPNGDSSKSMYTIIVSSSGPPPTSDGDANSDGSVDYLDYAVWVKNLLTTSSNGKSDGDFNADGVIDGIDFSIWQKNYGGTVSTPTPNSNSPTTTNIPTQPQNGNGIAPLKVATGAYPAIAVDTNNDVHIAYARGGKLLYKKYTSSSRSWSSEQDTGVSQYASYRNDPDIVTDSQNRPHVIGGTGDGGGQYAYFNGSNWVKIGSFNRDTAIAIDGNDNVYVVQRGGHSGGFIGVSKKTSNSNTFSTLPDPSVNARNDHVYTDIFTSPTDNSVHIAYRHGEPTACAYTYSTNGGSSWSGGGISGDDAEAPSGTVSQAGNVYTICGSGGTYSKSGNPSSWNNLGNSVNAGARQLPVLSTDSYNNLYSSSFGGKYNIRVGNSWIGQKTLSGLSTKSKGFMRVGGARNGQYTFAIWEEGNSNAANDNNSDNFDLVFASVNSKGIVGSF